jgi:type II secretory pathway pseudopilin PulG
MRTTRGTCFGFTLVEVCVATALFVTVLSLVSASVIYSMKKSRLTNIQNELDSDAQLTIESLRSSMRLSSLDEMYFYPEGAGPYTAVSFPQASDDDGDGLCEKDETTGKLIWDKTVIYHIWPGSPNELRITTFSPRDNSLTDSERQEQLDAVVAQGTGSGTHNGENASSRALFQNLLEWSISPESAFDGYSSSLTRDRSASVGYCLMGSGDHEIEFEVTGKNAASSGYKIGLDSLTASSSGGKREAEAQLPVTSQSGATAEAQYMAQGDWGGNYQLYFPATAEEQKFSLTLYNDLWLETNFRGTGHDCDKTKVVFDGTLDPMDFVVKLDGSNVAWEAAMQTGDSEPGSCPLVLTNDSYATARVLVRGRDMVNGGWLSTGGGKCRITLSAASSTNSLLFISRVRVGECDSSETASVVAAGAEEVAFPGSIAQVFSIDQGESKTSDWVNLSIDKDKSYLISYQFGCGPGVALPRYWQELNGATDGCYYVEGESASGTLDWSSLSYQTTNGVLGVSQIETLYEGEGTYTSPIYDTQMDTPNYNNLTWSSDEPGGASIVMKIRAGTQSDLSDASAWSNLTASVTSPAMIMADQKRYVQFQATLEASSDFEETPILKDVTIDWPGEEQLVDIGGVFTKGPDYGTFSVKVDGESLRSAVVVRLKIYKEIYGVGGEQKQVSSEAYIELRPRNTGK